MGTVEHTRTDRLGLSGGNGLGGSNTVAPINRSASRAKMNPRKVTISSKNCLSELDCIGNYRNCNISLGIKTASENQCTGGSRMNIQVGDGV